jgi:2-polyprenyl-3-methyl-5-hydroxy-6-metoxy-1,4-benzoquinol methylase
MKEMWNNRYAEANFVYGKAPNKFVYNNLQLINSPAKILFAAEGEGRNAVFAASKGHTVSAVDFSEEAKKKAALLANEFDVSLEYQVGNLLEIDYPEKSFDAVVLVFAHFPPQFRQLIHRKLQTYLKAEGVLLLQCFSKNHLEVSKNNTTPSGPQNIELLYSLDLLKEDFNELAFSLATEEIETLDEGPYHQGKASVIKIIGAKK